jgi:GTP cyclohydrolase II
MNHISRSTTGFGAGFDDMPAQHADAAPRQVPALPPGLQFVRHAILDTRAGLPVALHDPIGASPTLVTLPAETATHASLARFLAATRTAPLLVLATSRADALLPALGAAPASGLRALTVPPALLNPTSLQALADPALAQSEGIRLTQAVPPGLAAAALALGKLARLLPAMLVAEAVPPEALAAEMLTAVSADAVLGGQARAITTLRRVAEATLPLAEAPNSRLVAFRPEDGGTEHVALLIGRPEDTPPGAEAPLVRIHSECFTGDLLGSLRCDCGPQLHQAIRRMEAEGAGVLLYMAQEGRGIGLVNKLRAYALQDRGLDTLDANRALGWGADERDFTAAAIMLRDLGIPRIRLLTNNPDKVAALEAAGITVTGRLRHAIAANGVNDLYLETKARRFGHLLK